MRRLFSALLLLIGSGLGTGVWGDGWNVGVANAAREGLSPLEDKRAVFEEDIFWTDPRKADRMLERIRDAGFNVLVLNVWHGRGAMWPSRVAPPDPWVPDLLRDPPSDPLAYVIAQAKTMDIEVHAWFTVALRQTEAFPEFSPPGTPDKAFDIHDPNFQKFMADLVMEVVDRYDLQGVNLDYVRTMGLCRNTACQERYRRVYKRDLLSDIRTFESIPVGSLKRMAVPDLVPFHEAGVTAMVKTIAMPLRSSHPELLLSVDALPGESKMEQGQDSLKWLNEGVVDVVFRMDYRMEPNVMLIDDLRRQLSSPNALTLLISNLESGRVNGERRYVSRSGAWLARTVDRVWKRWPKIGIGIYMSKFLSDDQVAHLRKGPGAFPNRGTLQAPQRLQIVE